MGFGILIPMDSPMGMILGLFSLLIVILFILIGLAGLFTSIFNGIFEILGIINNDKDLWYHKKDKSNGIAFLCSLLLPFSGDLYLKENKLSLIFTILSSLIIIVTIYGLLAINDFYYHNGYVIAILVLIWIISFISLLINISQYKKYKDYFPTNKKTDLSFINEKILIIIPIIIFIIFISVNFMVMNDTSDKLYETTTYSVEYPSGYVVNTDNKEEYNNYYCYSYIATIFIKPSSMSDAIHIYIMDSTASAKETAESIINYKMEDGTIIKNIDGGKIKIDGHTAYCVIEKNNAWTRYYFKENNKLYELEFAGDAQDQNVMDCFINSFKFK